jgi:hypothetical protein
VRHAILWKTLAVAACALGLVACGKEGGSGKAQGPTVLKVNDWSYTTADLEREIGQELRRAPRGYSRSLQQGRPEAVPRAGGPPNS